MQLWLVRHAVAIERDEFEGPDAERPLTDKGRKRFRTFTKWLAQEAPPPGRIVTSPLLRAAQTAEILRKAFGLRKIDLVSSEALAPGAEAAALLELAHQPDLETTVMVGHEPDFSRALTELVGGGQFDFGKGFVAAIDFPETIELGAGQLRWFVGPKLAGNAGGS